MISSSKPSTPSRELCSGANLDVIVRRSFVFSLLFATQSFGLSAIGRTGAGAGGAGGGAGGTGGRGPPHAKRREATTRGQNRGKRRASMAATFPNRPRHVKEREAQRVASV